MGGCRIWLDLSDFHSNLAKRSCIFLDHEKLKTVKEVSEHICRVFSINIEVFLTNDEWLLPAVESSLLLRDNDIISVVRAENTGEFEVSVKSDGDVNTTIHGEKNCNSTPACSTLKNGSVVLSSKELENLDTIACPSQHGVSNGVPSTTENIPVNLKNPFANSSLNPERTVSFKEPVPNYVASNGQVVTPTSQDLESDINSENVPEKKRKRIRRRKRKSSPREEPKAKEIKTSLYMLSKFQQGVGHILNNSVAVQGNKKHIFFNEEQENQSLKANTKVLKSNVASDVNTTIAEPENISTSGENSSCTETLKNSAPSENNIPPASPSPASVEKNLFKLMSLGNQQAPVVFERKKSDNQRIHFWKPDVSNKTAPSTIEKLTPLSIMPTAGTVIKFKVLKMLNYSPTVSETITARIISPDDISKQIYVQITGGLEELQSEKGKFSLDEEEQEDQQPSQYMYLSWQDILEPQAVEYCES